jgi:subtilisin family serine protease
MVNKKTLMVFTLVFSLVISTTPLFVSAAPPEKINVIIGFYSEPNTALIKAHNGEVKNIMPQIHAVTATIPVTAISALQNNPNVRYIEEDKYVQLLQAQPVPWGVDRIDAEKVWSSNTGKGVIIAICDTGIDYDHPDLAANCIAGKSFVDYTTDPMDDDGHGTHCAGIAAAVNNDIGVVGVAPDANLLPVKVLNQNGGAVLSWIADGIIWAANNGADVISLSIGYNSHVQSWQDACDYAYYTKGCVVVAASGNDGNPGGNNDCVDYPGRYASTIAVAATTQSDSRASFSSTGPDVELAAPGYQIYSTLWDNTYDTMSGTSMACPHVSGVAALVIASGITNNVDVRNQMASTAEDLGATGRDIRYGYGLVDAEAAAGPPPDKHDVAITAINAPGSVLQGSTATIDVTVANEGTYAETTTVTLTDNYDGVEIGSQIVSLAKGESTIVTFSWDTTSEALGDHILEAAASVVPGETETADNSMTTTVNVYVQGTDGMYVYDISWSVKNAGPNKFLYHTVTVKAETGVLVSDATVYSTLTLAGGGSWEFSGITDANGQVKFTLNKAKTGDYTAHVTNIVHSAYTYNSALDVDNPDYYTLT